MSVVDDYIAGVTPGQRAEFERIRRIVLDVVPSAEQALSYGMPAYKYKGKPFISFIATKKHLSIYPFSGKVTEKMGDRLKDFDVTPGTIRFSEDHPVPEVLIKEVITLRLQEIEDGLAQ